MAGHRASARAARNWCERLCGRAGVLCDALRCTCVCVVQWRLTLRRRIRISALSNDSFKPPLLVGIGTFHARVVPPTGPRATRRQPPPPPSPSVRQPGRGPGAPPAGCTHSRSPAEGHRGGRAVHSNRNKASTVYSRQCANRSPQCALCPHRIDQDSHRVSD